MVQYVGMYGCRYVCMYVHTYIHTYIHTYLQLQVRMTGLRGVLAGPIMSPAAATQDEASSDRRGHCLFKTLYGVESVSPSRRAQSCSSFV
jgi:hypothetical protein